MSEERDALVMTTAHRFLHCKTKEELEAIKAEVGKEIATSAWKILGTEERLQLKNLCAVPPEPTEEREITAPSAKRATTAPSLLELDERAEAIDSMLQFLQGKDISPAVQEEIDNLLGMQEETEAKILDKLDNYCALIRNRQLWIEVRKSEAERLSKLVGEDVRTVDFLKERLKLHLSAKDISKVRTRRFSISVKNNGGVLPLKLLVPPDQLPDRFQKLIVEADKEAIRDALAIDDPDATLLAYLEERGNHISIR